MRAARQNVVRGCFTNSRWSRFQPRWRPLGAQDLIARIHRPHKAIRGIHRVGQ